MSAFDFLLNAQLRRQVMVQRFGGSVWIELEPVLTSLRDSLVSRLRADPTEYQAHRLSALLNDVTEIINAAHAEFGEGLKQLSLDLAFDEVEFQESTINQVIISFAALPSEQQIRAAITSRPAELITGGVKKAYTIHDMVKQFSDGRAQEIRNTIQGGFIEGATTDEIVSRVYRKIDGRTKAQARALVRTAVNHAAAIAREEFYAANKDVIEEEEYVATLDARTSQTCFGLDGTRYPIGKGPRPPTHYNCRSTRVAVPRPGSVLSGLEGERPAVGASGPGTVSTRKTFAGWLMDQPVSFRKEFFSKFPDGEGKRALFERGGLNPQDFIDPNGIAMSLDDLKKAYPLAWEKAGL